MVVLKSRYFDQGADGFGRIGRPYCIAPLVVYGIGVAVSALASWWGLEKQKQSQKEAIAANKETSAEELQLHKKEYADTIGFKNQEVADSRANTFNQIMFKEKDEAWNRQQMLANRLLGLINIQQGLKDVIFNRAAKARQINQPQNYSALNPIIGAR